MKLAPNKNEKIHIAIVDDQKMILDLLVGSLNTSKHCQVIFSAYDGQKLLDYLENCSQLPDICILDINMPVLNGYDTQLAIHKFWPTMKTLAMSIFEDNDCIAQMLINGANGFISKNLGVVKLEEAILTINKHGRYPVLDTLDTSVLNSKGLPKFTEREKEYLFLTCDGLDIDHIAVKMGVSIRTVGHYRDAVYKKAKVNNRADLILFVHRTGIVMMK